MPAAARAAEALALSSTRKIMKAPAIIFLVAGILPMVPGVGIYRGVHSLLFNTGDASAILLAAFTTTGVIALAIFVMETVLDIERRIRWRILKKSRKSP